MKQNTNEVTVITGIFAAFDSIRKAENLGNESARGLIIDYLKEYSFDDFCKEIQSFVNSRDWADDKHGKQDFGRFMSRNFNKLYADKTLETKYDRTEKFQSFWVHTLKENEEVNPATGRVKPAKPESKQKDKQKDKKVSKKKFKAVVARADKLDKAMDEVISEKDNEITALAVSLEKEQDKAVTAETTAKELETTVAALKQELTMSEHIYRNELVKLITAIGDKSVTRGELIKTATEIKTALKI